MYRIEKEDVRDGWSQGAKGQGLLIFGVHGLFRGEMAGRKRGRR